ncbi:VOC family protein [Aquidulcibacter sp.]|uniref:VOC family protein n=1 Tax=Aquidulcibacter sp. TaxID=2052990 RepID=UPI0025C36A81|nr:VOC family protein [Aquidulcibacter sp.]MCA3694972.1 VOC family protein [Aquidulcibacter sp.]
MFTHIVVGTNDLDKAARFYDAVLGPLGLQRQKNAPADRHVYVGAEAGAFLVMRPLDGQRAAAGNGGTIGFRAPTPSAVDAFHAAGLLAGGLDEGAPGPRPSGDRMTYGAYLRSPEGHKICAFARL